MIITIMLSTNEKARKVLMCMVVVFAVRDTEAISRRCAPDTRSAYRPVNII